MGYYTYFTLAYFGPLEDQCKLQEFEPEDGEFELGAKRMKELIAGNGDSWKWYGWIEDMEKLAKKFPNLLFVLDGDGENSDDLWEWRGKGDETEFHKVTMPPFTNNNLKIE